METFEKVLQQFVARVSCKGVEEVELDHSINRWIAQDVRALFPWPPFHRSLRDGFALDHQAVSGASPERPVILQVSETIPAGGVSLHHVSGGSATRILTGALLPRGATAVVPFEEVEVHGQAVLVSNPVLPGQHIRPKGSVVEAGEVVVARGTKISPHEVELLASAGMPRVLAFCQPVVSILPVGSELIEPGETLPKGKIYSSNGYTMAAWTTIWGGRANRLASVPDDIDQIVKQVRSLLTKSDVIVTTGGASQGDYDFAPRVLAELKATEITRLMPKTAGGPFVGGFVGNLPILSFSGSPKAAVRTGKLFLKPLLARMQGAQV